MPGKPSEPTLRALVAVDESYEKAGGRAALDWVAKHLCAPGTEIHVVTVLPPLHVPAPTLQAIAVVQKNEWDEFMRAAQEWEDRATKSLKNMSQTLIDAGVPEEAVHVDILGPGKGSTAVGKQLMDFAKDEEMDLIVMGSRGLGSFKKSIMSLVGLGSVSDYCAHNSPVPVMIVRSATPTHC